MGLTRSRRGGAGQVVDAVKGGDGSNEQPLLLVAALDARDQMVLVDDLRGAEERSRAHPIDRSPLAVHIIRPFEQLVAREGCGSVLRACAVRCEQPLEPDQVFE